MSNYLTSITKKSFWLPPPRPVSQPEVTRSDDEPSLTEATPAVISHIDEWPVESGRVGQASGVSSSRRERRRSGQSTERPFNAVDDSVLIPFGAPLEEKKIPKPMKPFLPRNRISNPPVTDALGRTVIPRTDKDKKTLAIFPRPLIEDPTPEVVDPQTGRVITPATEGKRAPIHPDSSELWNYQIPARLRVSPRNPRYPEPNEGDRGLPPNFPRFRPDRAEQLRAAAYHRDRSQELMEAAEKETDHKADLLRAAAYHRDRSQKLFDNDPQETEHLRAADYYNYLYQRFVHDKIQQRGQQNAIFHQIDQDTAFARQQAIDFGRDDPWDDSWMRTPSFLEYIQEQTSQQRPPYHGREAAQSLWDEMTSQEKAAYRQLFRTRESKRAGTTSPSIEEYMSVRGKRSQEKDAYGQAFGERATTEEEDPQESGHLQAAYVYGRLRQMLGMTADPPPANATMRQATRRGRRERRGRR